MVSALTIGSKHFAVNLVQGPLAGVSCAPFRRLASVHGSHAFTYTEMISSKTLLHLPKSQQQRFVKKDPEEGPVCFQLSANNPLELAEATKKVTDYGADLIDLNCGCPVKKIRRKGAGSRLLSQPQLIYQLITSMKKNTTIPVSIKIRVDGQSDEKYNAEIAAVVRDAGADFLTVHGRHWTEQYDTACRHDEIRYFVENLKIPVIGNGDVSCINSLKKMLSTGCAGVMISRAGVGQPWLTRQLIAEMQGEIFTLPSPKMIGEMFQRHIEELAVLLQSEHFAILQARQFAKYYARRLPTKVQFCQEFNECSTIEDFYGLILKHFQ